MKKIKIAQIITRMDWGGAPDIVRMLCQGLDAYKYEVTLVCGKNMYPTEKTKVFLESLKERFVIIPELKRDINPVFDALALRRLYFLFKKGNFDIVHTHTAKAGCLGRIAAKLANIKVIVHTSHGHNFYGYFGPIISKLIIFVERALSSFTDKIITLTRLEQSDLLRFKVAAQEKTAVAHTAVEFSSINKTNAHRSDLLKKELGVKDGHIVVGMVGRLEQIKGVKYFIEAALQVAQKIKNVQFVLVGEGSLKTELKMRVKQAGYEEHFIFCGWRDDVSDIMCLMDMMVLASLNEAVGLVLIEAQGLGIPVIASKVGGIPEVVDDGKSGILVEAKSAEKLTEAMSTLIQDELKRRSMGKAAADFVQSKYDTADLCRIIMQTYEGLLKG
ncbi:MAG: glycosyltransferase family 4 protein [Candidatus Omnitrophota bacterium]